MHWRFAWLLLTIGFLVGCAQKNVPSTNNKPENPSLSATGDTKLSLSEDTLVPEVDFPSVITSNTAYYTGGPQQGRPADGTLSQGTRVRLIENAGSYSVVQTADGIHAYVSTESIGKPEEVD